MNINYLILLLVLSMFGYSSQYQITSGKGNHHFPFIDEENNLFYSNYYEGNSDIYLIKSSKIKPEIYVTFPADQFRGKFLDGDFFYLTNDRKIDNEIVKKSFFGYDKLKIKNKISDFFVFNGVVYTCDGTNIFKNDESITPTIDNSLLVKLAIDRNGNYGLIASEDHNRYSSIYTFDLQNDSIKNLTLIDEGEFSINSMDILGDSVFVYSAKEYGKVNNSLYLTIIKQNSFSKNQITENYYDAIEPSICLNGNEMEIYYSSNRTGEYRIWRTDIFGDAYSFDKNLFNEAVKKIKTNRKLRKLEESYADQVDTDIFTLNRIINERRSFDRYSADLNMEYAKILYDIGNIDECKKIFDRNEILFRDSASIFFNIALERYKTTKEVPNFSIVKEIGEKAKNENEKMESRLLKGLISASKGNREDAENNFDAVIKSDLIGNLNSIALKARAELYEFGSERSLENYVRYFENGKEREDIIEEIFEFLREFENKYDVESVKELAVKKSFAKNFLIGVKLYLQNTTNIVNFELDDEVVISEDPLTKILHCENLLFKGKYLIDSGQYSEGVMLFKSIIFDFKDLRYGYYFLKAREMLLNPELKIAENLLSTKMYKNALEKYYEILEYSPNEIMAIRGIAECFFYLDDEANFINWYESRESNSFSEYAAAYFYSLLGISLNEIDETLIDRSNGFLDKAILLKDDEPWFYLTYSYNMEALDKVRLRQERFNKDKNAFLKSIDYVMNPVFTIFEYMGVSGYEKTDYLEQSEYYLRRGLLTASKDETIYLKLKMNLANTIFNYGEFDREQAYNLYKDILEIYPYRDTLQKAMTYARTGICAAYRNDFAAEFYFKKAEDYFEIGGRRDLKTDTIKRRINFYLSYRDKDGDVIYGYKAADAIKELINMFKSSNQFDEMYRLYRNYGFASLIDKEYDDTEKNIDVALELYGDTDIKKLEKDDLLLLSILGLEIPIWRFDLTIGSLYPEGFGPQEEYRLLLSFLETGNLEKKNFVKVIDLLEEKLKKTEDSNAKSIIFNRIASLCYMIKNYDRSCDNFKRSLNLCHEKNLGIGIYENLSSLLKLELSGYDTKLSTYEFYEQIEDISKIIKPDLYSNFLIDLASLHGEKNKSENSFEIIKSYENLILGDSLINKAIYNISRSEEPFISKQRILNRAYINKAEILNILGDTKQSDQILDSLKLENEFDNEKKWRYLFRIALLGKNSYKNLLEAEKLSSSVFRFNSEDNSHNLKTEIRKLYQKLVEVSYEENRSDIFKFIERYKNQIIKDIYSSRDLDFASEKHRAHIKKVRDSYSEIYRLRNETAVLMKDSLRNMDKIKNKKESIKSYESELEIIFNELNLDNDLKMLELLKVLDPDESLIDENTLTASFLESDGFVYGAFVKKDYHFFSKFSKDKISHFVDIFNLIDIVELEKMFDNIDKVYLIPDFTEMVFMPLGDFSDYGELKISFLTNFNKIQTLEKNKNINNDNINPIALKDDLRKVGTMIFEKVDFEYGNPLDGNFGGKINIKELHEVKTSPYCIFFNGEKITPESMIILVNSGFYLGSPIIVYSEEIDFLNNIFMVNNGGKPYNLFPQDQLRIWGDHSFSEDEILEFAKNSLNNYVSRGSRFYNLKRYSDAIYFYEIALKLAEKSTNSTAIVKLTELLFDATYSDNNYYKAISYGEELKKLKSDDLKSLLKIYQKMSVAFFKVKDYKNSIFYQEEIKKSLKEGTSSYASIENSLASIYFDGKNYDNCIKSQINSLEMLQLLKDKKLIYSDDIGNIKLQFAGFSKIIASLYRLERYEEGTQYYLSNSKYFDKNYKSNDYSAILRNSAYCFMKLGKTIEAENLLKKLLKLDNIDKSDIYLDLCDIYFTLDRDIDFTKSIKLAYESTKENERIRLYNTEGLMMARQKKFREAENLFYKAMDLAISSKDDMSLFSIRANCAKSFMEENKYDNALKFANLIPDSLGNIDPLISANYVKLVINNANFQSFIDLADVSMSEGNYLYYVRSMIQASTRMIENKNFVSADSLLVKIIKISSDRYFLEEKYSSFLLKSRTLSGDKKEQYLVNIIDQCFDEIIVDNDGVGNGIIDKVRAIFDEYSLLKFENLDTDKAIIITDLRNELLILNRLKKRALYDENYYLNRVNKLKNRLNSENIIELNDKTLLISFNKIDNNLLISYNGEVQIIKKVEYNYFENLLSSFKDKLVRGSDITNTANDIYKILFNDFNLSNYNKIIFMTNPEFYNFPWDAIVTNDGTYLVEKFDIKEIFGLFDLSEKKVKNKNLISFVNGNGENKNLEYAEMEANRGGFESGRFKMFKDKDAIVENLPTDENGSVYHFATHSGVDENGELYIVMSKSSDETYKLSINDFQYIGGSENTLVLSSCSTGLDFSVPYQLLNDNFYCIVSTTWRTDDLSSAVLMKRFFRYFFAGKSAEKSLCNAKRDLIKYYKYYPYYWAGYKVE
ncbi:MAG: CHAT domain-containing protein [Candidatus Delongbacteria bacterium]|nr:CHAT domain-containing protein [Candidatus Delongbacteria bacterium]